MDGGRGKGREGVIEGQWERENSGRKVSEETTLST